MSLNQSIVKKALPIICGLLLAVMAFAQNKTSSMTKLDYEQAWKEVHEFEQKGLPESALKVVNNIYAEASKDGNAGQLVKAIIHQLKFTDYKDENAFVKNLLRLKEESGKAVFPTKPLLHSMLAEMYWQYYQNNRYRFNDRTQITAQDENDIETWGLHKIVSATFEQYKLSLEEIEKSKVTSIGIYEDILTKGNAKGRRYRATLYDFLAHRALDFARNQEANLTQPVNVFHMDDASFFEPSRRFMFLKLESPDSLSMKYFSLKLFQQLLQFHANDSDPESMTDVDIDRLTFVYGNSMHPDKQKLYRHALDQLEHATMLNPVSTRITYLKAIIYRDEAAQYKPLEGDSYKWELKKAIALCDSAIARFKNSEGTIQCEILKEEINTKALSAKVEENNLPDQPFRSLIQYKNFKELHYRIVKVTRDEVRAQRKKWENNYNVDQEQKFMEYFTAKLPLKKGQYVLPDDGDFQTHSVEVKIDPLSVGEYMLIFSNKPDFTLTDNGLAYAFTTITRISYIHRTTADGGTDCFVLNRQTGEPLSGVTALVYSSTYNYKKSSYQAVQIGTFKTDTKGYFHIPYFGRETRRNFFFDFVYKEDKPTTISIDNKNSYDQISQYPQGELRSSLVTHFFLDRAIYRPGQTIYFKGLVVSTNGKISSIVPRHSTTLTLYDVNNQAKGEIKVTSNEYGTYSGTLTAPSSGLTGQMRIQDVAGTGSVYFSVEEYKRPKFEVAFEPVTGSFRLNDTVTIKGHAKAYSGANIDGALVTYRVVRTARFPIWWGYRWSSYPNTPSRQIMQGETKTDADGKFAIDFTAIPDLTVDKISEPTFDFVVYADVTDINGETHSQNTTVSVGYKSLNVSVSISAVNIDEVKTSKDFIINTTNLAGQFEPATGTLTIHQLKDAGRVFRSRLWDQPDKAIFTREQYYEQFPYDLFDDETNKYKWEKLKQVFKSDFNTAQKKTFAIENLQSWTPGEYVLEAISRDKDNQEIKELVYFTVFSPAAKEVPTHVVDYFQTLKFSAEPGEQGSFVAGTSEKSLKVLYEIEQDGRIITSEWLTLKNEQRQFKIAISEQHRGNLGVHYTFVKNNRMYKHDDVIYVPFSNKQLDISFETFRDKLQPGANEEWRLLIKGTDADKVAAEMVTTLYDESLDTFRPNNWYAQFFSPNRVTLEWNSMNGFGSLDMTLYTNTWNNFPGHVSLDASFDHLNWFDYNFYGYYGRALSESVVGAGRPSRTMARMKKSGMAMDAAAPMALAEESEVSNDVEKSAGKPEGDKTTPVANKSHVDAPVRTNFNETAFFLPHLQTNDKGEIIVKFTIPEALTRWKMLGFAHTKDLKSGFTSNHLVTQKELMVVPNQPRFFREGDKMSFAVKITSLLDAELSGQAQLEFIDPFTGKAVNILAKGKTNSLSFKLLPKQSSNLEWAIEIPDGMQALTYRITAKAGNFSDGEEMTIPVLTNRMLVTESLPLPIRGNESKDFRFEKLLNNSSPTLRHQQFTLEFTSNPAWYAVQALPYLMEYPYDCVEQTFSKFYANSIASHIANSNPKIKQVFDAWKNIQPNALLSNLEKNQELKTAILEETPWVLQANDESQRKRNVALLFDLNRMANEKDRALDKVAKAQNSSGGFSWFPGFPEDRYMTQHIVSSMGHLDVLGVTSVRSEGRAWSMVQRALNYLDAQINDDYRRLKAMAEKKQIQLDENHIGYPQIQYLYARSFFKDVEVKSTDKEAFQYFLGQAKKYWLSNNIYMEGMTSLALLRFGEKEITASMIKSFKERSLSSEEMGMYWKSERGYYWYQAPIETQALMIEVFDEVANDQKSVGELKVWLLKQKQTQDWKTTKATSEACYALLRRGTDILTNTTIPSITLGSTRLDPGNSTDTKVEAGTGYFKTSWKASEIQASMGKIHIEKKDPGVAWGAAYWQYFEQLDKITVAETPLKIKKDLYKMKNTDTGQVISPLSKETSLKVGDLVKVRIEIRVDRNMEYVHLKDMRAAGLEPLSTISTYKYQDGLYYYESTRDMATNFFIGYLPKGTFVFEYSLRVSQKGNFSNGVTTMQCMYAPEFTSHSQGLRINID